MVESNTDQTGGFGELLAAADLSRPVRGRFRRPLFRPTHLGGKYPVVDYMVDVLAPDGTSLGFFFVQVKATTKGKRITGRLPVSVSRDRFSRLARIPAPSYLVGVDVNEEVSYIIAADRTRRTGISSITRTYSLRHDSTKIILYREVVSFWRACNPILRGTHFKDV